MIVNDFNIFGIPIIPLENNSPLIINPYGKKSFRSPFNFSSLLEGGIFKSGMFCELFSILSFRRPISWISKRSFLTLSVAVGCNGSVSTIKSLIEVL
jgi:hypothetical protein